MPLALGYGPFTPSAVADGCSNGSAIERVSITTSGAQTNDASLLPAINEDGCVVAFKSSASNIVTDDRNGKIDVFVRDRSASVTERVTVTDIPGTESNDNSFPPALSADGRFVAFGSLASNLLRGDFNSGPDVFVYDRLAKVMEILTLVEDGNGIGRGGGGVPDAPPSVSADGNFVAFASSADDLVANDRNEASDVFVYDRSSHATTLLSVISSGSQQGRSASGPSAGAAISADGCVVAFYSDASNIVPRDTNGVRDVFVRDRCSDTTERVSVSSTGDQANGPSDASSFPPAISADGRYVAFASDATNLVPDDTNGTTDIFIRDREAKTTTRVQLPTGCSTGGAAGVEPTGFSDAPSLSTDGRFLAFMSLSSNLVADDTNGVTDIFVLDRASGLMARVLGENDMQPNAASSFPRISGDGQWVVFQSDASNLVADDTNGKTDIFVATNPFVSGDPIPGVSPLPTCTPTETPSAPPTSTPTPTITASPTRSARPTMPSATMTPSPSPRPTPTSTVSPTATHMLTMSPTSTRTPTVRAMATETSTRTPILTQTSTATLTGIPTPTSTHTPEPSLTWTPKPTSQRVGGGGGCSCVVDPEAQAVAGPTALPALALPVCLWALRRIRRRGS